jgi:aminoglycoside phosphotransferase
LGRVVWGEESFGRLEEGGICWVKVWCWSSGVDLYRIEKRKTGGVSTRTREGKGAGEVEEEARLSASDSEKDT